MNLNLSSTHGVHQRERGQLSGQAGREATNSRAVVIGAGIGGLLASRVLSDHYDEVVILERDELPATGSHRRCIPQGRHVHALMAKGLQVVEHLFPGISADLVSQGAVPANAGMDVLFFQHGGYHCQAESKTTPILIGRPLLESTIRQHLLQNPNIRIIERCAALGLLADDDGSRITGVRTSGGPAANSDQVILADMVVDSGGRGSKLPRWLKALGYEAPKESRMESNIHYSTRCFRRSRDHMAGKLATVIASSHGASRSGIILAQEGETWLVTLIGRKGVQPPKALDEFIDYARRLEAPEIADTIRHAEPLGDASVFGFPHSQWRHYERLNRFPEGLLAFGDAICGFNPVFGQGMTIAALEAECLDRSLAEGMANLAHRFFTGSAPDIDAAWELTTSEDLRFAPISTVIPRKVRVTNWYLDHLHVAARHEPAVTLAFREVVNVNQRPASLLRPGTALRVLRGNLHDRLSVNRTAGPFPASGAIEPLPSLPTSAD